MYYFQLGIKILFNMAKKGKPEDIQYCLITQGCPFKKKMKCCVAEKCKLFPDIGKQFLHQDGRRGEALKKTQKGKRASNLVLHNLKTKWLFLILVEENYTKTSNCLLKWSLMKLLIYVAI